MRVTRRFISMFGLALALMLAMVAAGCGSSSSSEGGASTESSASADAGTSAGTDTTDASAPAKCNGDKLSFQLAFFPNAEFSGFLVAQDRGFYKDVGLDVDVKPGGPTTNGTLLLSQGNVDIALVDNFSVVAKAKGAPITLVGETFRIDPSVVVAKASSGITSAADLKGKTIGLQKTGAHPSLEAVLHAAGLSDSDVKFASMGFGIDDILAGKVDAGTQQLFFHKAQWEDAGYEWPAPGQTTTSGPKGLTVLSASDNANVGFGEAIAVNNDYLSAHRDAVKCFMAASLRGWQFAIDHPKQALRSVMKTLPKGVSTDKDQYVDLLETNGLVLPKGTPDSALLTIGTADVQAAADFLKKYGVLKSDADVSSFVDDGLL